MIGIKNKLTQPGMNRWIAPQHAELDGFRELVTTGRQLIRNLAVVKNNMVLCKSYLLCISII